MTCNKCAPTRQPATVCYSYQAHQTIPCADCVSLTLDGEIIVDGIKFNPFLKKIPLSKLAAGVLPANISVSPSALTAGALPPGITISGAQVTGGIPTSQTLSLSGSSLSLSGGNSISLSGLSISPSQIVPGKLPEGVSLSASQLTGTIPASAIPCDAIYDCLKNTPAGTIPANALAPGQLPAGVTIPASSVIGGGSTGTPQNLSIAGSTLALSGGNSISLANLPISPSQITSGPLPATTTIAGSQITGTIPGSLLASGSVPAGAIAPGPLPATTTIAGSQVTGTIPATAIPCSAVVDCVSSAPSGSIPGSILTSGSVPTEAIAPGPLPTTTTIAGSQITGVMKLVSAFGVDLGYVVAA